VDSFHSCVARGRWFALLVGLLAVRPMFAATPAPGFTVKATDLSLSGQGSGTSQFTLTSVQGYADTGVIVKCTGPNPNLLPFVVLPECSIPEPIVNIPAGGSVSGTINFFPPWTATQASSRRAWPLTGTFVAGIGLMGFRRWKRLGRRFATAAAILSLIVLTGVTGCVGHGGLAMTPGIYTFVISGTGKVSASANISVTVKCNSCP
jgi:hypothetical protein